jgi:hypothetical protein
MLIFCWKAYSDLATHVERFLTVYRLANFQLEIDCERER